MSFSSPASDTYLATSETQLWYIELNFLEFLVFFLICHAINAYGTLFKVEHFQMVKASLSFALTKTTPKVINFNFSLFQPRMRLGGLCAAHIWNRIKLPQVV